MRLRNLLAAAAVPAVLPLLAAGAASASPQHHHYYHLTARTFMVNRTDNGHGPVQPWANDNFVRTLTLTPASNVNCVAGHPYAYTARLDDRGTFTTIPGAYTPNQSLHPGQHIWGVVHGQVRGFGEFATFCASNPANMWLVPRFDYGNTHPSSTWPGLAFRPGPTSPA
ncbi:MAG: hypothetical protein J2P32_12185 [Actinobacteria bacterium]|nr:hypothetical protein [Actinomycetota bacterium]